MPSGTVQFTRTVLGCCSVKVLCVTHCMYYMLLCELINRWIVTALGWCQKWEKCEKQEVYVHVCVQVHMKKESPTAHRMSNTLFRYWVTYMPAVETDVSILHPLCVTKSSLTGKLPREQAMQNMKDVETELVNTRVVSVRGIRAWYPYVVRYWAHDCSSTAVHSVCTIRKHSSYSCTRVNPLWTHVRTAQLILFLVRTNFYLCWLPQVFKYTHIPYLSV